MAPDEKLIRVHVSLPRGLVQEIDALVGSRCRSAFLAAAAREKLSRLSRPFALSRSKDFALLTAEDYPEWRDAESTARWVDALRAADAALDADDPCLM